VFQWLLYIKYGGFGWVGKLSDFVILLQHNTTKRLPNPALRYEDSESIDEW